MAIMTVALVGVSVGWIGTAVYLNHLRNLLKIDADQFAFYVNLSLQYYRLGRLNEETDRFTERLKDNVYAWDFEVFYAELKEIQNGKLAGKV